MASIVKRKNTYSVGYANTEPTEDNKIIWETYYEYDQALNRKKELDEGLAPNILEVTLDTKIKDYIIKYCNIFGIHAWSISSYQNSISITHNYLSPIFKNICFKDLDSDKASKIYTKLVNSKAIKGNTSIHPNILSKADLLLRSSFDYVIANGLDIKNYFHDTHEPITTIRTQYPEWTKTDILLMLKNCDHRYLFLLLHLILGCRLLVKEALALTWNNVHIDEPEKNKSYLEIKYETNRYPLNTLKKLNESSIIKIYKPTTCASSVSRKAIIKLQGNPHKVSIPDKLVPILKLYRDRYLELCEFNPDFIDDGLLFSRNDGYPYEYRVIEKEFNKLKKELEMPQIRLAKLLSFSKKVSDINNFYKDIPMIESIPQRKPLNFSSYRSTSIHQTNNINVKMKKLLPKKEEIDFTKLEETLKNSPELVDQLSKLLNL